jgi:hypothetical protein
LHCRKSYEQTSQRCPKGSFRLLRIAISGTHCSGKSTLAEALLMDHPVYIHEPEAYEAIGELFGETFPGMPTQGDLFRQLDYHVQRLRHYKDGDCVIFERTTVDYVAYIQTLEQFSRSVLDKTLTSESIGIARENMKLLDAIVFLPLHGFDGEAPVDEDLRLRRRVDSRLQTILLDDELDLFGGDGPVLVEATGTTQQRLAVVNKHLTLN